MFLAIFFHLKLSPLSIYRCVSITCSTAALLHTDTNLQLWASTLFTHLWGLLVDTRHERVKEIPRKFCFVLSSFVLDLNRYIKKFFKLSNFFRDKVKKIDNLCFASNRFRVLPKHSCSLPRNIFLSCKPLTL